MIRVHFTIKGIYEFDETAIETDVETHIDDVNDVFIDRLGHNHNRAELFDVESNWTQEII